MFDAAHIFETLEARRQELGLSQGQLAERAFGNSDNSPWQHLRRGHAPKMENLAALCAALGLELYMGPPRQGSPQDPLFEIDGEAYAALPFYGIELSAGPGVTNTDEQVLERVAFRREWLRDHVDNPDRACLLKVRGDSMEPRLQDGDLVLIDRSRAEVRGGSIYAFVDSNGDTRVKRLDRPDKSVLVLRSDNPDYPTELRRGSDLAALRIIGEVVWSGHTWR